MYLDSSFMKYTKCFLFSILTGLCFYAMAQEQAVDNKPTIAPHIAKGRLFISSVGASSLGVNLTDDRTTISGKFGLGAGYFLSKYCSVSAAVGADFASSANDDDEVYSVLGWHAGAAVTGYLNNFFLETSIHYGKNALLVMGTGTDGDVTVLQGNLGYLLQISKHFAFTPSIYVAKMINPYMLKGKALNAATPLSMGISIGVRYTFAGKQ